MIRLTLLCFAGTYGLALLSELARLSRRVPASLRYLPCALIALGWLVQAIYLANLAIEHRGVPLSSGYESMLVLGWALAAIALILEFRSDATRSTLAGPIVLSLILVVLTIAGLWAPRPGEGSSDRARGLALWGTIHGVFQTLGAVGTCLAFLSGLMYLAQTRRLKRKQAGPRGLPLPNLEQLDRWHRMAIYAAFPLLTLGVLSGLGLIVAVQQTGGAAFRWTDPKVLSTLALWLVSAALLIARFLPEWQGRKVMILTVLAFLMLAFTMVGVGLIFPTGHRGLSVLPSHGTPRVAEVGP